MGENCVIPPVPGKQSSNFSALILLAAGSIAFAGASASAGPGGGEAETDPMRFFEGRTESESTVKIIMRKAYRSRTIGDGRIEDGVLHLVQHVRQDGKAPYDRRWRVRQVGPGRFTATMSEASGPVTVEQVGDDYRFRFKMKGNLSVEQWLMPLPGGTAARSKLTVRKLGIVVGRSQGTVRKI